MRTAVAALVLGFSLGAVARADDLSDPVWVKAPDRSDWARAYPAQAAQAGLSGSAQVRCAATSAGALENCAVVAETPTGAGFGAAALSLMGGMELRSTSQSGQLIAGKSVLVPIKFTPEVLQPGAEVTHPDWVKKPNSDDMARFWPANAGPSGGRATVTCVVTNRGLMEKCEISSEEPSGQGFGAAAVAMTSTFLMRPMTIDGQPVGGASVSVPIKFVGSTSLPPAPPIPGGWNQPPSTTVRVLHAAAWAAAPTPGDIAAVFPKGALGQFASGHVVLRCAFEHSGKLEGCETISEDPKGHGFEQAAKSLTKDFRMLIAPTAGRIDDFRIDIPFDLRDPSQPVPPIQVYDAQWLKRVDPTSAPKLFPEAAAKAGLKEGRAAVECEVTHEGTLTGCTAVQEDPKGYGFGEAALTIAGVMQMNLWTSQGTPVDGARIRLPVTLKLPDEPAPAKP